MNDAVLRSLEREAQRDPSARPRLLAARLRAGGIDAERVELMAYCSDVHAITVLGLKRCPGPVNHRAWLDGLDRWACAPYYAPLRVTVAVVARTVWAWSPRIGPGGQSMDAQHRQRESVRGPAVEAVGGVSEWLKAVDGGATAVTIVARRDRVQAMHDGPRPWSSLPMWCRYTLSLALGALPGGLFTRSARALVDEMCLALDGCSRILGRGGPAEPQIRGLAQGALIDWANA